jgi:PBSX family phage terminase large subunit
MRLNDSLQGMTLDPFLLLRASALQEKRRRQAERRPKDDGIIDTPTFRGAGLEVQTYRRPEFILAGPSETGKTWSTLWLLDSLLKETPGAQAGLVRKVAADIVPTVLVTYKRVIQQSKSGALAYGGEKPEWFDYPNGAKLYIGGMDRPGKVLSGERDFIYVNQAEELTLDDWETLTTRTTGRGAVTATPMLFGDCNPGPEDHWILKREALKVFYSKHEDNPSLFDRRGRLTEQGKRSMAALDALTGIRKARLRYGKWVGAEGLFFEEWDEDLHTCEPFNIPEDWPIWGALDYGFSHNTAAGLFTEDNDGCIYLIGEHVKNKWLAVQHAKAIHRLAEIVKVDWRRVKRFVAGHDVFQKRGAENGKTIADQYADAVDTETEDKIGIKLTKATLDRINGAQELLSRLGVAELGIEPTLKIFNTCRRTIATMTRMVCDPSDPEDVKKVDSDINGLGGDDPYDMIRYGVMVRQRVEKPRPKSHSVQSFG